MRWEERDSEEDSQLVEKDIPGSRRSHCWLRKSFPYMSPLCGWLCVCEVRYIIQYNYNILIIMIQSSLQGSLFYHFLYMSVVGSLLLSSLWDRPSDSPVRNARPVF